MARKGQLKYSEKSFGSWWEAGFYNPRFKILHESLNPVNAPKFKAMPLKKKKGIIARLIEGGLMN